jgi:hypothetical protein
MNQSYMFSQSYMFWCSRLIWQRKCFTVLHYSVTLIYDPTEPLKNLTYTDTRLAFQQYGVGQSPACKPQRQRLRLFTSAESRIQESKIQS